MKLKYWAVEVNQYWKLSLFVWLKCRIDVYIVIGHMSHAVCYKCDVVTESLFLNNVDSHSTEHCIHSQWYLLALHWIGLWHLLLPVVVVWRTQCRLQIDQSTTPAACLPCPLVWVLTVAYGSLIRSVSTLEMKHLSEWMICVDSKENVLQRVYIDSRRWSHSGSSTLAENSRYVVTCFVIYDRLFVSQLHCVSKTVPTFKLSVTFLNLNQFSKFLHCWKFATKSIWHYPLHTRHVATLPWEMRNSNFLQVFSRYGRKCKQIAFKCTDFNSCAHVTVYAESIYMIRRWIPCWFFWQTLQWHLLWQISSVTNW